MSGIFLAVQSRRSSSIMVSVSLERLRYTSWLLWMTNHRLQPVNINTVIRVHHVLKSAYVHAADAMHTNRVMS